MKVKMECMESMARDMRHPYIPSTTVLGDISLSHCISRFYDSTQAMLYHQGGCDKVTRLRNDHMITPTYYACIVYAWHVNSLAVTTRRSNFSSQFRRRINARLTGLRYAYS